jgi:hypothetical protein
VESRRALPQRDTERNQDGGAERVGGGDAN